LWNKKARLWLNGRKNIFEELSSKLSSNNANLIWVHCSSLGEFEQGRPVIESLKSQYPGFKLLVTFFSPSGYEIRKDYKVADWVFYLPMDSGKNAVKFFDIIKPSLVIFLKYDYWYYYLSECKKRNIPLLMISAIFKKDQPFFKWYGNLHRKMLKCFTHFFVQDED
jgi:3-deoxy-D-manno-octulosonic-acid transferase